MKNHIAAEPVPNEVIRIAPYDSIWPTLFHRERRRIHRLSPQTILQIRHFGSTAVPGLPAKPIIDLLAGLSSEARFGLAIDALQRIGYQYPIHENAGLQGRRWLYRVTSGRRTHNLHLVVYNGTEWKNRLAFRRLLTQDVALRQAYASLKQQLAIEHPLDRASYNSGKQPFVQRCLQIVRCTATP